MDIATSAELIAVMRHCRDEITALRREIATLAPKAEAYDAMCAVIDLVPKRQAEMSEDLVTDLNRRIRDLEELTKHRNPQPNGERR